MLRPLKNGYSTPKAISALSISFFSRRILCGLLAYRLTRRLRFLFFVFIITTSIKQNNNNNKTNLVSKLLRRSANKQRRRSENQIGQVNGRVSSFGTPYLSYLNNQAEHFLVAFCEGYTFQRPRLEVAEFRLEFCCKKAFLSVPAWILLDTTWFIQVRVFQIGFRPISVDVYFHLYFKDVIFSKICLFVPDGAIREIKMTAEDLVISEKKKKSSDILSG